MNEQPANPFLNPEVFKRLLFTFICLTVYIVGRNIPIPGLSAAYLDTLISGKGGASLHSVSIFKLGLGPYIAALVLLSVLRAVGNINALAGKDAEGRNQIYKISRFVTAVFAVALAGLMAVAMQSAPGWTALSGGYFIVPAAGAWAAGTLFLVWLAEEITENGIGNGVLLILFVNIAAAAPGKIGAFNRLFQNEEIGLAVALGSVVLVLGALFASVLIETAQRKIPVQYAKRVVGRMMMGGQQTTIPVKVNPAGVLALVAASMVASWPQTFSSHMSHPAIYFSLFAVFVVGFSRLYRTANVDPRELAGQIQNNGGFIAGLRSGDAMLTYFSRTLERLSVSSAVPVMFIALAPVVGMQWMGVPLSFRVVSIYLVAAVALDFMGQVQARAMMQNFGGNMPKPGSMKGGGQRPRSRKRKRRR